MKTIVPLSLQKSVLDIKCRVASEYGIPTSALDKRSRKICYTWPRHIAIYIVHRHLRLSLEQIGACFGGRDLTTACYSVNRIRELLPIDRALLEVVTRIEAALSHQRSSATSAVKSPLP